jgi:hypothetical protein
VYKPRHGTSSFSRVARTEWCDACYDRGGNFRVAKKLKIKEHQSADEMSREKAKNAAGPNLETGKSARRLGDWDLHSITVEIYARHSHHAPPLLPCPIVSAVHLRWLFLLCPWPESVNEPRSLGCGAALACVKAKRCDRLRRSKTMTTLLSQH